MPSTFTQNLGIEKPASGEQTNTWGITANRNFDVFDRAIAGSVQVTLPSAGTTGAPNLLASSNGALSNGQYAAVEFIDGADLGDTAYVQFTPVDGQKLLHVRNSLTASRDLVVFQDTYNAPNAYTVANGQDVLLKIDGAGVVTALQQNVTYNSVTTSEFIGPVTGNAATATAWETARTLEITGDVTGVTAAFDGTGNITLAATVADDSHTHDGRYFTETEADARFATTAQGTNANTAFGWGDHNIVGYLTSVAFSDIDAAVYYTALETWVSNDLSLATTAAIDARIAGASLAPVAILNDLADVDTLTTPATDRQPILWNAAGGEFRPADLVISDISDIANLALNDLSDVNTSGISDGQALLFNSTSGDFEANDVKIVSYTYANRNNIRATDPNSGDGSAALIETLGFFVWSSGSTEVDDDETCFATPGGRWLQYLPSFDFVNANIQEDERVITAKFNNTISSVSVGGSNTSFSVIGAPVGAAVTVTPSPVDFSDHRFSVYGVVEAANVVTVYINYGGSGSTSVPTGEWSVAVHI